MNVIQVLQTYFGYASFREGQEFVIDAILHGRDGESAECILLFSPSDITLAKRLIESGENRNERLLQADYNRLEKMVTYCKSTQCLKTVLLSYFGQIYEKKCGNCSNCLATFYEKDITVEAQKIMSCIKRIENSLGYTA